jgi:NTP pyrophosphatase (non-canonical NTP hydrolase)
MNEMNELIKQVKQWGVDKGITGPNGKGTLLGQLSKTQEELTETRDAAVVFTLRPRCEFEREQLQDGIGDCTVTLILAAEMAGLDFEECLRYAYDEIKGRTGRMENGTFVKNSK